MSCRAAARDLLDFGSLRDEDARDQRTPDLDERAGTFGPCRDHSRRAVSSRLNTTGSVRGVRTGFNFTSNSPRSSVTSKKNSVL